MSVPESSLARGSSETSATGQPGPEGADSGRPEGRQARHIAFYLDQLTAGGGQMIPLMLADSLVRRGRRVDLVVCEAQGQLMDQLPEGVRLVVLKSAPAARAQIFSVLKDPGSFVHATDSDTVPFLPDLVEYLRRQKPDALLSSRPHMNAEASLARRLAGVPTRIILGEYNQLSESHVLKSPWRRHFLLAALRRAYVRADAIVALSDGVAEDLADRLKIDRGRITTIYPPVPPDLAERASQALDHPWFAEGSPPVILGVGRLTRAKDFPTLIRAFAHVRKEMPARLLILGDTGGNAEKTEKRQKELSALADELGVGRDVALPGYVRNPLAYMSKAAVFALSSITEGFGMVVAEALACGCQVVSTDCPSGPAEILDHGRYGRLVPVRDPEALGRAIVETLRSPADPRSLRERGLSFDLEPSVDRYEALIAGLV